MKKLIFLSLLTAIPLGAGISLVFQDFTITILITIAFWGVLTAGLITINYSFNKWDTPSVKQERNIHLNLPYDKTFELCQKSISTIHGAKLTLIDPTEGLLRAKTKINIRTWGDTIEIKLYRGKNSTNGEAPTIARIQSRPAVPTTIIDYGKNKENIDLLTTYLEAQNQ
ncbi:hypothetical protein [Evansella tamaricis]|uniref:Photosystem I assembly protein Ycf4 n=1 Tax=Evansella tamaricis TaxID=2069301 RepID=A0ABS6JR79_9BACI|nr:hypothetical protein [Evansella tamaricis]MBU9714905.1 hypothetical protein [Evansella tamaricis]